MEQPEAATAPESGPPASDHDAIPTLEQLQADPEIEALLDFEPAPRQNKRKDGWNPERQRHFVALLALTGSPNLAADAMKRSRYGAEKVYHSQGAESFAAAWDAGVALYERRLAEGSAPQLTRAPRPPAVDRRRGAARAEALDINGNAQQPGQVMNEVGEWEDEESFAGRAGDAMESIRQKLLRCRRAFLAEIAPSPGKRAAFEILTELPVDWDKAARWEAQDDEPYKSTNQHQPDMVLTAESGWGSGISATGRTRWRSCARRSTGTGRRMDRIPSIGMPNPAAPSTTKSRSATPKLCRTARTRLGWPAIQAASAARSRQVQRHVGFTPRDETFPAFSSLPFPT